MVHAGRPRGGVPEALAGAIRAARERARRVGAAALQDADALAGLRQAIRRHRATEARADDDGVVVAILAVGAHRANRNRVKPLGKSAKERAPAARAEREGVEVERDDGEVGEQGGAREVLCW